MYCKMILYVSLAWCASADETILYYLVRFATIATLCHHHHHHETMILKLQSCCRCCSQLSEAASCSVCIYVCLQRGFFILCTFANVSVFIFHTWCVVVKNIDLIWIQNFKWLLTVQYTSTNFSTNHKLYYDLIYVNMHAHDNSKKSFFVISPSLHGPNVTSHFEQDVSLHLKYM